MKDHILLQIDHFFIKKICLSGEVFFTVLQVQKSTFKFEGVYLALQLAYIPLQLA